MNAQPQQLILPKTESWKMFNAISRRYDFLNRVLSFGQDLSWRRKLAEYVPPGSHVKLLDLATGTGDVLITLLKLCPNIQSAVGVDMAGEMLALGRWKIERAGLESKIFLQQADARHQFLKEGV